MQAHCAEATARSATVSKASASACTSRGDAYEPASRPRISARSEPTRRVHAALRRSSSNGLLLPVLVLAAASGVSTGVACSNYKTGGRETGVFCAFAYGSTAFMHSHCPRVPWFTRRTAGEGVSSILPPVCAQRVDKAACWKGAGAWKWRRVGMTASTALFDSIEGQPKANWRPPPLETYSRETSGSRDADDLTPSHDSEDDDEEGGRPTPGARESGTGGSAGAVVVGAGALRGEQEAYTMRDVQSMKVPRLRAMCEARGLKKNGTKQELIRRLLASTADTLDNIPGWTDRKSTPTPTRLNPQLSLTSSANGQANGRLTVEGDSSESNLEALELDLEMSEIDAAGQEAIWSGEALSQETPGFGRNVNTLSVDHSTDPDQAPLDDFRPSPQELEAILKAPRLRRRAGVTYEFADSKINKYERDRTEISGSRISALPPPRDTTGVEIDMSKNINNNLRRNGLGSTQAYTLNGIPREFLPPSLRAFDPGAQNKRRGPGRPRSSDDDDGGVMASEWAMVKSGGGMTDLVQESPFDAMIRADMDEEERLNPKKRRKKKLVVVEEEEEEEDEEDFSGLMNRLDDEEEEEAVLLRARRKALASLQEEEEEEDAGEDLDDELPDLEEEEDFLKTREVSSIKGFVAEDEEEEDDDDDPLLQRRKIKAILGDDIDPEEDEDEDEVGPVARGGRGVSRSLDDDDDDDDTQTPPRAEQRAGSGGTSGRGGARGARGGTRRGGGGTRGGRGKAV